jgi:hypothetical protein
MHCMEGWVGLELLSTLENRNFSALIGTKPQFSSCQSCSTVTNWLCYPAYTFILFPHLCLHTISGIFFCHACYILILSPFFNNFTYCWEFNQIHRICTLYIRVVWRSYPVVGHGPRHILVNLIIALVPNFILFWEQEIHKLQQNTLNHSAATVKRINILNHSGYGMYHLLYHSRNVHFELKGVWLSKYTVTIPLNGNN